MSEQQNNIVWIASYPKSGNTWVRFLACNLAAGPVDSAEMLNRLAPDLHELREVPDFTDQRLILKTHFPYSAALPLVDYTDSAIYVVRDPADVMLSNFHYSMRRGASKNDEPAAFDRYVDSYIAARGDPRWVSLRMGNWEENVRSWRQAGRVVPVLWLRYEDLLADPMKAAGSICRHLGIQTTPESLAQAVAGTSFERMRQIEEADIRAQRVGIFYKPYLQSSIDAGSRFMRGGQSGEGRRNLSQDQQRRFDAVFGPIRRELGYG
jgi:Sulfotransferase domain